MKDNIQNTKLWIILLFVGDHPFYIIHTNLVLYVILKNKLMAIRIQNNLLIYALDYIFYGSISKTRVGCESLTSFLSVLPTSQGSLLHQ